MLEKKIVYCPRCGSPMKYVLETEKYNNGVRRVNGYYICPVCRYKLDDLKIDVASKKNGLELTVSIVKHRARGERYRRG